MSGNDKNSILIGTSGFSYKDWLGNFYPQFCPDKDFLRFYATRFKTVEIDSTFYRIPAIETVKRWGKVTPDNFVFTAKFPRTVTHEGSPESRIDTAEAFIRVMSNLEDKLGPLLLQFPYSFKPDDGFGFLDRLLDKLPTAFKYALEVRNRKWLNPRFYEMLADRNVSLCHIDHPWMPEKTEYTAGFLYIRFLGDRRKIESDFTYIRNDREKELNWWARLIEEFAYERGEVYSYFNNHYSGHSPSTAFRLLEILSPNKNSKS